VQLVHGVGKAELLIFLNIKMVAPQAACNLIFAEQDANLVKIPVMTKPTHATPDAPALATQPRNPLHGMTLQAILTALVDYYGWPGLGERIAVRCFTQDPSIASSLKFLRKTPWARDKVEGLYLFMLREQKRQH